MSTSRLLKSLVTGGTRRLAQDAMADALVKQVIGAVAQFDAVTCCRGDTCKTIARRSGQLAARIRAPKQTIAPQGD